MTEIMLDLEFMALDPNAAIVSIGAVAFSLADGKIYSGFHQAVDLTSSIKNGGVVHGATVSWWLQQSQLSRNAITQNTMPLINALEEFSKWVYSHASHEPVNMWGNGAATDNPILRSAYTRAGVKPPWNYKGDRCYRTLKAMSPGIPPPIFEGEQHIAINDALHQARHLFAIFGITDPIIETIRRT